jgi:hypothetical protein
MEGTTDLQQATEKLSHIKHTSPWVGKQSTLAQVNKLLQVISYSWESFIDEKCGYAVFLKCQEN